MFATDEAFAQHRMAAHRNQIIGGPSPAAINASRARNMQVANPRRKNYDGSAVSLPFEQRQMTSVGTNTLSVNDRSGVEPPDFRNKPFQELLCSVVGNTSTGRAWAMAALHPCGASEVTAANVGDLQGMSDTMTGSVATPVYRSENHFGFSKAVFVTETGTPISGVTGATTYGVDIIIPPFPEILFCYRLIDDDSGITSPWVVVRQPDYSQPTPVAYGTTPETYGYNQATTGVTMASVGYGKVRIIGRGLTIELDAAALNDQGRVVAGQMQGQLTPIDISVPGVTANTAPFVTAVDPTVTTAPAVVSLNNRGPGASTKVQLLSVPTDPGVISANCPSAYQGLAKHGAYIVQKFASPLYGYEFKTTGSHQMYETAADETDSTSVPFLPYTALAISSDGFDDSANLDTADAFWVAPNTDGNNLQSGMGTAFMPVFSADGSGSFLPQCILHPFISDPSDMMTSVVTFRNLPAGVTNGMSASLRIKGRTYLESISNGSNPVVSPYIHSPADFDMKALHSVIVAGKRMQDAYPASANSLGGILGSIWGAIRNIGRPIIKGLAGTNLPILSDIANVADEIVGGIDNFMPHIAF